MIKVYVTTEINAPVEKVWEFLSNLNSATIRDPSVVKVDWQPPLAVGSVATVTHRMLGERTARFEVKELVPKRKIRAEVTSMGAKLDGTYEMEPTEGGMTKLKVSVQVEVSGLMKLLSPYISRKARKDGSEEIERIKRVVEGRATK